MGFHAEDVAAAAELIAASRPSNPRPVDAAGVRALLLAALSGDRPGPAHYPSAPAPPIPSPPTLPSIP